MKSQNLLLAILWLGSTCLFGCSDDPSSPSSADGGQKAIAHQTDDAPDLPQANPPPSANTMAEDERRPMYPGDTADYLVVIPERIAVPAHTKVEWFRFEGRWLLNEHFTMAANDGFSNHAADNSYYYKPDGQQSLVGKSIDDDGNTSNDTVAKIKEDGIEWSSGEFEQDEPQVLVKGSAGYGPYIDDMKALSSQKVSDQTLKLYGQPVDQDTSWADLLRTLLKDGQLDVVMHKNDGNKIEWTDQARGIDVCSSETLTTGSARGLRMFMLLEDTNVDQTSVLKKMEDPDGREYSPNWISLANVG